MKKLVVLIQKSARNISNEDSLVVLIGNIKSDLEFDFQNLQKGNNTLDLIYANIILMGNLLLYTFSHTSELVFFSYFQSLLFSIDTFGDGSIFLLY